MKMKTSTVVILLIIAIILAIYVLFPFYLVVLNSFKTQSAIVFNLQLSTLIPYLAFIVAAFSAVRLAKFNLDTRQTTSFIGLPTPANALFWGSLIVGFGPALEQYSWFSLLIIAGIFLSSWMLVAEVPMFALKFKHWSFKGNEIRYLFIIFSAIVLVATIGAGIFTGQTNLCYSGFSVIVVTYILVSLYDGRRVHA